jgi:hypothetical protein
LGELQRSVLDPALAARGLGFRAEVGIDDGIVSTWKFISSEGTR